MANWIKQFPAAALQLFLSVYGGRGLEHHFPTLYSQVGGTGTLVETEVHKLTFDVVVVVTVVAGLVVVDETP